MIKIKETLYGEPKGGKAKQWSVYVDGDKVIVEWGRVGGKLQTKETICTPKNVGRSNETSAEQQAVLEAESKWTKQWDKYYRLSVEDAINIECEGVMLAQDYTKKPNFLQETFYASPKLDGLRVRTVFKVDAPTWQSRGNKEYPIPNHIIEELKQLKDYTGICSYDGEAYIHGVKLQNIQSCVKKHNELTPQVTYQIFDIPAKEFIWVDRYEMVKVLQQGIDELGLKYIKTVPQYLTTKEQIKERLHSFLNDGYEGAVYRNPNGVYEFQNKRSNDLLKHKEFFDSEALVVGCREDKNNEGVLMCKWGGVEFELKMKGDHSYRCYENQLTLIGKWVNFKYQDTTEAGVPTFAVGQYTRECDSQGNPLE